MALLPKTISDFTDPRYWRDFFANRKSPFEWYGDYDVLGPILEKYLKPSDKILQIGCGNSLLASQMYDNGFHSIHSIDIDSSVVEKQRSFNKKRRGLTFKQENATEVSLGDESFSVVVDKGTLDALLPPDANCEESSAVAKMFREVVRILQISGRYIIISLAQEHIIRFWMDHFTNTRQFLLRAHKLENSASGFPMPVFFLIATKLRMPTSILMPIELCRASSDRPERLSDSSTLVSAVLAEQELSRFIHMCSRKLDTEVSIDIEGKEVAGPRYRIHIVDNVEAKELKEYAVFVVPIGRDGDWIFATEKGRRALRLQTQKDRLAIVTLLRGNKYGSLQDVKDELGWFMVRFDPRKVGAVIDFLSIGSVDVRRSLASGESLVNGKWVVEDVVIKDSEYRRLVFLSSQNLVQSEAPLKQGRKGKKVVDLDTLSCDHHNLMLSSLALLPSNPLAKPEQAHLKVAVLGLGGGLLAAYLLRRLPKATVVGVELDPEIVNIATQWFSFPSTDQRLHVRIMDAVQYLDEKAKVEDKLDILLVDLAGSMHDDGLNCPPAIFLTQTVLANMRDVLQPNGVLALNLVTRDEVVAESARRAISTHFPALFHIASEEDVNEVLLASPSVSIKQFDGKQVAREMRKDLQWVKDLGEGVARIKLVVQ